MRVPAYLAEVSALPTIEVEREGAGFKATCPAFPELEPISDASQVIANALMQKKVHDHLMSGFTGQQ